MCENNTNMVAVRTCETEITPASFKVAAERSILYD